ncbi:MAG: hypothetical protein LBJ24_00910 [Treponema sp.]|nr:hypothetical protein [Treponema sp.]
MMGGDCIFENRNLLAGLGKKVPVVTGKHSAKTNGSLTDMVKTNTGTTTVYAMGYLLIYNKSIDMTGPTVCSLPTSSSSFLVSESRGRYFFPEGGFSPLEQVH